MYVCMYVAVHWLYTSFRKTQEAITSVLSFGWSNPPSKTAQYCYGAAIGIRLVVLVITRHTSPSYAVQHPFR